MSDSVPPANPTGTPPPPETTPPTAPTLEELTRQAEAAVAARLKAITGHDSLDALQAAQNKAEAERLAEQGKFQELATQAAAERDQLRAQLHGLQIQTALLQASAQAIDPALIQELLAPKAVVGSDGAVTIDGKPVADAVSALLTAKPYLARPTGSPGSGTPASGGTPGAGDLSMKELAKLRDSDPTAYAAEIKRRAKGGK